MDESLIIVTADHSHSLSINGYADRGNDIFGIAQKSKFDGIPYTTLTYATGGPDGFQVLLSKHHNITTDINRISTIYTVQSGSE